MLRPTQVGDFMFALPALAALRKTYPAARIVYLGRAWHQEFLESRTPLVDEVIVLPPIPGVGAPPDAVVDEDAVESACEALRRRNFDIAFQFYGGGGHSNPFVRRLGARLTVGVRAGDAEPLDRWLPYVPWHNERLRLLETVGLAGAPPVDLQPLLPVLPRDSGPLQMAQAVGTPAVGIFWFVNLLVSGPLTSYQNRCAASLRRACPVCGEDNLTRRCKHDPSFVDDVSIEEVRALALELWNLGEAASSESTLPAILR